MCRSTNGIWRFSTVKWTCCVDAGCECPAVSAKSLQGSIRGGVVKRIVEKRENSCVADMSVCVALCIEADYASVMHSRGKRVPRYARA